MYQAVEIMPHTASGVQQRVEINEQRSSPRYRLIEMVRYRVLDRLAESIAGIGQTVNVSGSGMLLRLQHALHVEDRVAVSVDLVPPDNAIRAELTLLGQVVRVHNGSAAIKFDEQSPEELQSRIELWNLGAS
jgi:hypothetical protein